MFTYIYMCIRIRITCLRHDEPGLAPSEPIPLSVVGVKVEDFSQLNLNDVGVHVLKNNSILT